MFANKKYALNVHGWAGAVLVNRNVQEQTMHGADAGVKLLKMIYYARIVE